MRILFDQGTPVPLRHHLSGHSVATAYEMGWSDLANGDLLAKAESQFDLMVSEASSTTSSYALGSVVLCSVTCFLSAWYSPQTSPMVWPRDQSLFSKSVIIARRRQKCSAPVNRAARNVFNRSPATARPATRLPKQIRFKSPSSTP